MDIEYAFTGQLLEIRPTKASGVVKLELRSRNTPGGKLGLHVIDHEKCRLISPEEREPEPGVVIVRPPRAQVH